MPHRHSIRFYPPVSRRPPSCDLLRKRGDGWPWSSFRFNINEVTFPSLTIVLLELSILVISVLKWCERLRCLKDSWRSGPRARLLQDSVAPKHQNKGGRRLLLSHFGRSVCFEVFVCFKIPVYGTNFATFIFSLKIPLRDSNLWDRGRRGSSR